jgi:hypothetical protein
VAEGFKVNDLTLHFKVSFKHLFPFFYKEAMAVGCVCKNEIPKTFNSKVNGGVLSCKFAYVVEPSFQRVSKESSARVKVIQIK